jgi:hypothetical protein
VVATAELLTKIRRTSDGIILRGIDKDSDGIKVDMVGQLGEIGTVFYSPKASANVLSFAAMSDAGATIRFDSNHERFTLQPKGSQNIYSFCRQDIAGSAGRFYVCDTRTMIGPTPTLHTNHEQALVTTVADNMKRYTQREVETARKARELLSRMGYPSVENTIAKIKGGDNFGVSEDDFRIADAIWGKDITSMRGKTRKSATPVADIRIAARVVQQQQVLSVDIMFVESIPSLIAVSTPLDLVLAVTLKTADMSKPKRTAQAVKHGLEEILSTLRSRGFDVTVMMSDVEAAIGKLKPYLLALGIEIDISRAGGHVARVEKKIQMIKERIRCHMTGRLPFTLTGLGISMLVLFCVSRLNFQHSGTREGLCPSEAFSGRRVDGKTDFKIGCGDYALCTVPNTDNRMGSRVVDCYAVLPTGNRTGTVKFYDIHNKTIISRDQFMIRPMPESVIQTLSAQAAAEGRKINSAHMHVFDELLNSRKLRFLLHQTLNPQTPYSTTPCSSRMLEIRMPCALTFKLTSHTTSRVKGPKTFRAVD